MAKRAVEHIFTGTTTPYTAYDSTRTTLGALIQQRTGAGALDNFAGPMPLGIARPMEASTPITVAFPHVISFSSTIDWVFLAENSAAAATRRIVLYTYNKTTSQFTWNGFITLTFPTATTHAIRGFRMSRELYTVGTASVSGTAVTGSGTAWQASNLSVGSRIGFGSTDPTAITTWFEISAIGSDTSITLSASAGSIGSGTYVIEDLRCVVSTTNATLTNGGVFIAKGLRFENFAAGGFTIPAATTVDNIRAVYWLADAVTLTNTTACGLAIGSRNSWTNQLIYVIDGLTTTCRVYAYNIRASLASLSAGRSVSAFTLVTGAQTPVGTVSQLNNGRVDTLAHGPGSGVESLYFVTTTRIYRAALTNITSGNTTWQSDVMVEVPPGSTTTFPVTSALTSIEVAGNIDRLIVMSSGAAGARSYVTQYNTISNPMDHIFLVDTKQQDQSTASGGTAPHPSILATSFSVWSEGGIAYLCKNGTAAATNTVYTLPLSAHWTYAGTGTNQRLVTPSMPTPNATKFLRAYLSDKQYYGDAELGVPAEPVRMYYRTAGITDNSGSWTLIDDNGDLTGAVAATEIQLMIEFKILGLTCLPSRVYNVCVVYEDDTTLSNFQPSVGQSSTADKRFAWRFASPFGGTVPRLRVRLFDAVSGGLLADDDSVSQSGSWEKSTDGGATWGAYNTTDKTNETTYIRFTPASLADNIRVRSLLTLF
jgi:hypothetical protein